MATKLGRSPVTKVMDEVDATSDATSTAIHCQRYADEQGAVQVEFNQDPVGTGEIIIEGRLGEGLSWGTIADSSTHSSLDVANFSASVLSIIAANITICPQMRVRLDTMATIAASTTVNIWIQE
jgi:hypothetical protein